MSSNVHYHPLGLSMDKDGMQSPPLSKDASDFHSYPPNLVEKNNRRSLLENILHWTWSLFLPLIAAGYLAFCYAVYKHTVPVNGHGFFDDSPQNLASVKSGITSVSILIIAICVWPCRSLIQDIKSEEFFRTLSQKKSGVPLNSLNSISTPSYGTIESMMAMIRKRCSSYFIAGFVAGFMLVAVTTLAPAALTAEAVLFDGDLMAFSVGAIPENSALNVSDRFSGLFGEGSTLVSDNAQQAASIVWAESDLGVKYLFQSPSWDASGSEPAYIVPVPSELPTNLNSRWLTDVIGLRSSCSWAKTNLSSPTVTSQNISSLSGLQLTDLGMTLKLISAAYLTTDPNPQIKRVETSGITNSSTGDIDNTGTNVWILSECTSCLRFPATSGYVSFDLNGTSPVTIQAADYTVNVAVLACQPGVTIETREARNDGESNLSVQPLGSRPLTPQKNLNPVQTRFLLGSALQKLNEAGPDSEVVGMGSDIQAKMIFPPDQLSKVNTSNPGTVTIAPLPTQNITQQYTRYTQIVMKTYVSGKMGRANVPGRVYRPVLVFNSSLPHVIASTIIFMILSCLMLAAHFRNGKGEQFTLSNVASALNNSDIPSQFAHHYQPAQTAKSPEGEVLSSLGQRRIVLRRQPDGSSALLLS